MQIISFLENVLVEENAPLFEDAPSLDVTLVGEDAPLIEDAPSMSVTFVDEDVAPIEGAPYRGRMMAEFEEVSTLI